MKKINVFIKGIAIGFVSVAIPGFSASTLAIILGIYYLMIDAIGNIFKTFRKSIVFLLFLISGYAVGAFIGANLVSTLYELYPLVTVFVIIGFIIGTLPKMFKEIKPYLNKISNWLVLIIIWLSLLSFSFLVIRKEEVVLNINMSINDYITLSIVGILTAGTLVIPGMDFAIVLLSLGYYQAIMGLMNIFTGDILNNFIVLGVYLIGYGVGAFLLSKLIQRLASKHQVKMKFANLAFVSISPFLIIKQCIINNEYFDNSNIVNDRTFILSIILGIIAMLIVLLVNHLNDPNDTRVAGMKKRNLLRFYFTIGRKFPLAIKYIFKMRKITKENVMPFEERYALCMDIVEKVNKSGRIYVQVFGQENLNDLPTLYIVNHQGRYDGIGVFVALKNHPCTLIADKSRIIYPFYSDMFYMLDGAIIDKTNMRAQVQIMKDIGERLANGRSFIGFIEGKWSDNKNTLQEFYTGILRVAYYSHVQIVPIVLWDTWKVFSISSIKKIYPETHILKPIPYEDYKDLSKQELADLIKSKMQEKLDEIYTLKNIERTN